MKAIYPGLKWVRCPAGPWAQQSHVPTNFFSNDTIDV